MTETTNRPIAVIGAGPVGLATAAHLAQQKLPFVVLEKGSGPAPAMRDWGHVTIFSPWRYIHLEPNAGRAERPFELVVQSATGQVHRRMS